MDIETLTKSTQTPFFLVDEQRVVDNYNALTRGLGVDDGAAILRYCVKTNNELGILKIMTALGSHAMVSCVSDLQLAVSAGIAPERMTYQSPVIQERELHDALDAGVRHIHVFRTEDLNLLEDIAQLRGTRFEVSLRVHHETAADRWSPLSFLGARMEFRATDVIAAGTQMVGSKRLALRGLNFYLDTQQASPGNYADALDRTVNLAVSLRNQVGISVHEVNCGGGIPSPTMERLRLSPGSLLDRWRDTRKREEDAESVASFGTALRETYYEIIRKQAFEPAPTLILNPVGELSEMPYPW